MLRATLKGLFAHKTRLALTALAIVFGVSFVAGTFIFTDTIDATFTNLFEDVFEGTDVIVQSKSEVEVGFDPPAPFDESVLDVVAAVEGVRSAEGAVTGSALLSDKDGDAIQPMGPPTLGGNWNEDPALQGNTELRDGRPPTAPGEIVIDARTARDNDLTVGDVVDVVTDIGPGRYEIVGIVGFGESDNLAGATVTLFETAEAQRVLDLEGRYSGISVVGDEGIDASALALRIGAVLPPGIEAITAADEAAQASEQLSDSLGFLSTVLLVFAGISVFVGAFIIQNTFRIVVAQRTREMGLLRAVGATGGQIIRMVLLEALIVAVVASALGILFGFVISGALTGLMSAIGFDLPSTDQQLAGRTIAWSLAVGVVVTLVSALLPAAKAARVPPIAAMQDVTIDTSMSRLRLIITAFTPITLGALLVAAGLLEWDLPISGLWAVGIGVLLIFVGVAIWSAWFVEPLARVIGAPMAAWSKVSGRLAQENAMRRPQRTAATASALMIGLALVGFFFILGESIKASTGAAIEEGLRADYVVSVEGFANGFPTVLADDLRQRPEIAAVTNLRLGFWDNDGTDDILIGIDAATVDDTVFLDVRSGSVAALEAGGLLVYDETADDNGWEVGDTVPMGFTATGLIEAEVVGTFAEINVVQAPYLVGIDFFEENYSQQLDFVLAIKAAQGIAAADAAAAVEAATMAYPNVKVEDQAEYRRSQEEQVGTLLNLFNALLALAVVIALLGITNTLVLSIIERTREVGLLRAVGMSRWQVRRMVLWESITVAVIGGVFGLVLGVIFGVVLVQALGAQGVDQLAIPTGQLVLLLVFSAFVGVLAGLGPARKAARLNILEAIAYE